MPHPVVQQDSPHAAKGQRTIESFFKTFHTPKIKGVGKEEPTMTEEEDDDLEVIKEFREEIKIKKKKRQPRINRKDATEGKKARDVSEEVKISNEDVKEEKITEESKEDKTKEIKIKKLPKVKYEGTTKSKQTNITRDESEEIKIANGDDKEQKITEKSKKEKEEPKIVREKKNKPLKTRKVKKEDRIESEITEADAKVNEGIKSLLSPSHSQAEDNHVHTKCVVEISEEVCRKSRDHKDISKDKICPQTVPSKAEDVATKISSKSNDNSNNCIPVNVDSDSPEKIEILLDNRTITTKIAMCNEGLSFANTYNYLSSKCSEDTAKGDSNTTASGTVNTAQSKAASTPREVKKEKKNAFAFMMANRYKQNDILKEIAETEISIECRTPTKDKQVNNGKSTKEETKHWKENGNDKVESGSCNSSVEDFDDVSRLRSVRFFRDVSESENMQVKSKHSSIFEMSNETNSNNDVAEVTSLEDVGESSSSENQVREEDPNSSLQDFYVTPDKIHKPKKKIKTKDIKKGGPRKSNGLKKISTKCPDSIGKSEINEQPGGKSSSPSTMLKCLNTEAAEVENVKKKRGRPKGSGKRKRGAVEMYESTGTVETSIDIHTINVECALKDTNDNQIDKNDLNSGSKEEGKARKKKFNEKTVAVFEDKKSIKISETECATTKPQIKDQVEPVKKRPRKRIIILRDDSEDDYEIPKSSKAACESKDVTDALEIGKENENCNQSMESSKTNGITNFFKKISQEEKSVARNKNVIKVKADVHASFDGNQITSRKKAKMSECGDKQDLDLVIAIQENIPDKSKNWRRSHRKKKATQYCEIEELNKIELLEQIAIPPSPIKKESMTLETNSTTDAKVCNKKNVEEVSVKEALCDDFENKRKSLYAKEEKDSKNFVKPALKKQLVNALSTDTNVSKKEVAKMKNKIKKYAEEEELDLDKENHTVDKPAVVRRSIRKKKLDSQITIEANPTKDKTESDPIKNQTTDQVQCKKQEKEVINTSSSDFEVDEIPGITTLSPASSEANEDEKENCGHYTSLLLGKPGKLRLRLKRVELPLQRKGRKRKTLGLKQENLCETGTIIQRANKLVKRAKESKVAKKSKKCNLSRKSKMYLEDVAVSSKVISKMQVNMALVNEDIVILDEPGNKVVSTKQIKKKKRNLLKLPSQGTLKNKGKKKEKIVKMKKKREIDAVDEVAMVSHRKSSRQAARKAKEAVEQQFDLIDMEDLEEKASTYVKKGKLTKDRHLAPIFCKKSKSSPCVELVKVVPLSPSKVKARQDFLQSGVPDEIKKQVLMEKSLEDELNSWPPFPVVSHVQQKSNDDPVWSLDCPDILGKTDYEDFHLSVYLKKPMFQNSIASIIWNNPDVKGIKLQTPTLDLSGVASILMNMKRRNPQFPVYKVFKRYYDLKKESVVAYRKELEKEEETMITLDEDSPKRKKRKRKGGTDSVSKRKRSKLSRSNSNSVDEQKATEKDYSPLWHERIPYTWTQVFAPKSSRFIIGNTGNVKKLKVWLNEWKTKYQVQPTKQKIKKKKKQKKGDFIVSDESSSWEDDDEIANTYLLSGPPGTGKTSTVFALAAELGYKVLEVNASSRRPGRQVMSQLAEATQSHSVSNTPASQPASAFSSFFTGKTSISVAKSVKKVLKSKNENCQKAVNNLDKKKAVSLVLLEDIDVVFDEWDDGFMTAVNNFIATAKTPIILTVSHPTPSVLAKIKGHYEEVTFVPPPVDIVAQHMQLVSLANGYHICPKDVEILVHINSSDIRQCLLDLQLLALSGSSTNLCYCGTQIQTECLTDNQDGNAKDINMADIFPGATSIIPKEPKFVKLYKADMSVKYQVARVLSNQNEHTEYNQELNDRLQNLTGNNWNLFERNLPSLLPFPLKEREESKSKYPINPNDPILKTTTFWEHNDWLSLDDDDDKEQPPEVVNEEKRESQEKCEIPQHVEKASRLSLQSLANLYDTFTQLDILASSHVITHPNTEIKDRGWWVRQPTAGLSDSLSSPHPYWAPYDGIDDMVYDLSQRALMHCNSEITTTLLNTSAEDWTQLCLPIDIKKSKHRLLSFDTKRERDILCSVWNQLPPVVQLNRSAVRDYLAWVRSMVRQHEVFLAIRKKRQGRRMICHLTQAGWNIVPNHRHTLANALTT